MLDERQLKRKVLLRTLGSPFTILPFMAGMTVMAAGWAFGWQGGYGWFAGLAGLLGSAGAFTTKLLLGGDKVASQAAAEMNQAEKKSQERALNDLDRRLTTSDNDPRPETALRDLRELLKVFEQARPDDSRVNITSMFDIQSKVGLMFEQCVRSLEQTDQLRATAERLNSDDARKPIIDQREEIIARLTDMINRGVSNEDRQKAVHQMADRAIRSN